MFKGTNVWQYDFSTYTSITFVQQYDYTNNNDHMFSGLQPNMDALVRIGQENNILVFKGMSYSIYNTDSATMKKYSDIQVCQ